MSEVWKPIVGFEQDYEVSNLGRVMSLKQNPPLLLKQHLHTKNYYQVQLYKKGKGFSFRVHRLVLDAFVGCRPQNTEACHADGNKLNNKLENLRWDSQMKNHLDRVIHGRLIYGSKHPNAKLNEQQVMQIKSMLNQGFAMTNIAKKFNVSHTTIKDIKIGKQWRRVQL